MMMMRLVEGEGMQIRCHAMLCGFLEIGSLGGFWASLVGVKRGLVGFPDFRGGVGLCGCVTCGSEE